MGFYAKGSPNAFLHLTKSSDARNGVTDDTIFHSAMPHIFVDEEYEAVLNPVRQTNFTYRHDAIADNLWGGGDFKETTNLPISPNWKAIYSSTGMANVPAKVSQYMRDSSKVILTVVEYKDTNTGKTYSKIVSGNTSKSEILIGDSTNYRPDSWLVPTIDCRMALVSNINNGMDITVGYSSAAATFPHEMAILGTGRMFNGVTSVGIQSVGATVMSKDSGSSMDKTKARRFYASLLYDNVPDFPRKWGLVKGSLPSTNMYGYDTKTVVVNMGLDTVGVQVPMAIPSSWMFSVTPLIASKYQYSYTGLFNPPLKFPSYMNGFDPIPNQPTRKGNMWMNSVPYCFWEPRHPRNKEILGNDSEKYPLGQFSVSHDTGFPYKPYDFMAANKGGYPYYGSMELTLGSFIREQWNDSSIALDAKELRTNYPKNSSNKIIYPEPAHHRVDYTNLVPTKIRWLVLNINFNASTRQYSVIDHFKVSPAAGIKISGDTMSVAGVDFKNFTKYMLHQVDVNAPGQGRIISMTPTFTSATPTTKPALPVYDGTALIRNPTDGVICGAGARPVSLSLVKLNGSGWYCKSNEIGNNQGAIWSPTRLPLKYVNEVTRKVNLPEATITPSANSGTYTLLSKINLGLSKTRTSTVILSLFSTDPSFVYMGGLPQNVGGFLGSTTTRLRARDAVQMRTDHQILTLEIGRLTPFRLHRNALSYNLFYINFKSDNTNGLSSWEEGITYFLKNNGDGTVDIIAGYALAESVYNRKAPGATASYTLEKITPARMIHFPAMELSIHKLI